MALAVAGLALLFVLGLRVRRQVLHLGGEVHTARERFAAVSAALEQLAARRPEPR